MIHLLEFPCESQLCTWIEFSFVCVCVLFYLVEHLLLMGLAQLSAGSEEARVSFVNLNEEGSGGRGSKPAPPIPPPPRLDPKPQLNQYCQRGVRLVGS